MEATLMMYKDGTKEFFLGESRYPNAWGFNAGLSAVLTYDIYLEGAERISQSHRIRYNGQEYDLHTKYDPSVSFGEGYRPYILVDGEELYFEMAYSRTYSDGPSIQVANRLYIGDRSHMEACPGKIESIEIETGIYSTWQEVLYNESGRKLVAFGLTNGKKLSKAEEIRIVRANRYVVIDSGCLSMWSQSNHAHRHFLDNGVYEVLFKIDKKKDVVGVAIAVSKDWAEKNTMADFEQREQ